VSWELGPVYFGLTETPDVGPWTEPPATWSEDFGVILQVRHGFAVVKQGAGGPIAQGEIGVERSVDGGPWIEVARSRAMDPGTIDGLVTTPPDYTFTTLPMLEAWAGVDVKYRGHLYWTEETNTEQHLVHVAADLVDAGELAEFFQEIDHGVEVLFRGASPMRVRGIFDDPGVTALRVQGHLPQLLVEHELVAPVIAGDPMELRDTARTFAVRGKRRDTDLARLVLEETT
jgi:hypothetical protein